MQMGRAVQLEVETRRPGAEFRNRAADGPYLRIKGALWQLPSRATAASPKFVDGKPVFGEVTDKFPAAEAMLLAVPEEGGTEVKTCPTCAHQTVAFDALEQTEWLGKALECAAEALAGPGGKYDLSDEHLGSLLSLEPEASEWLVQLSQWAKGEPTAIPPRMPMSDMPLDLSSALQAVTDWTPPKKTLRQRCGEWLLRR